MLCVNYKIIASFIFQVSPTKLLTCYQVSTGKELILHLLYKHELVAPQGMQLCINYIIIRHAKSIVRGKPEHALNMTL